MTNRINLRVGSGFDVHAFEPSATLTHITLGGVTIPYIKRLKAHSDGDVVIHALVDALLGASALGDIGQYFPDTDSRWKGKESRFFLQETVQMLREKKWSINNVDITILAQAPKLSDYRESIRLNLAKVMNIAITEISVKASTTEKLGFIGREEGLAATATVLIFQKDILA